MKLQKKRRHKHFYRIVVGYDNGVKFKCSTCDDILMVKRRGLWAMFVWGFAWTKHYRTNVLYKNNAHGKPIERIV